MILLLFKILLTLMCGFLLGIERERARKPAGLRDVILVMSGALVFTMFNDPQNRMIANIVTGIGFLGGGVIIKDTNHIEGVTTATTLWVAVAIGIGIGIEHYLVSLIMTLVVFVVLNAKWKYRK